MLELNFTNGPTLHAGAREMFGVTKAREDLDEVGGEDGVIESRKPSFNLKFEANSTPSFPKPFSSTSPSVQLSITELCRYDPKPI